MAKHSYSGGNSTTSAKKEILSWFLCIAIAVAIALSLRIFVFELVKVNGDSMEHTLHNDQTVFVEKISRNFGNLDHRQIVIVKYPNKEGAFVKRVVGLPGDIIEVKDGALYVNNERQDEPYLAESVIVQDFGPVTVPENCYFVMGDNRNYSMDSRDPSVGPIPYDQVIGHAMFVIWPFGDIAGLTNA